MTLIVTISDVMIMMRMMMMEKDYLISQDEKKKDGFGALMLMRMTTLCFPVISFFIAASCQALPSVFHACVLAHKVKFVEL